MERWHGEAHVLTLDSQEAHGREQDLRRELSRYGAAAHGLEAELARTGLGAAHEGDE